MRRPVKADSHLEVVRNALRSFSMMRPSPEPLYMGRGGVDLEKEFLRLPPGRIWQRADA